MEKGKIIVIEGSDCSGKETQTRLLMERLKKENINVSSLCFPAYDTATGRIIGLNILGKPYLADELVSGFEEEILENVNKKFAGITPGLRNDIALCVLNQVRDCLSKTWFKEGAANIDSKVASLYYATDRLYNVDSINERIDRGENVILDRYVYSNMGHQAGKLTNEDEKIKLMKWIENLEFGLLDLPRPDLVMFLHMPYKQAIELRKNREEVADEVEKDENYLINSEKTFLLMAREYNYNVVSCVRDKKLRTIEDIHEEVYTKVKSII